MKAINQKLARVGNTNLIPQTREISPHGEYSWTNGTDSLEVADTIRRWIKADWADIKKREDGTWIMIDGFGCGCCNGKTGQEIRFVEANTHNWNLAQV